MTTYTGGSGNDNFGGTSAADFYALADGGNDTASGGGGSDIFSMGGALSALDKLNGGAGYDIAILNGNYAGGVTLGATTMLGIEEIDLFNGNSYKLTTNDATVATSQTMVISAGGLGAAYSLNFDGSAESDGFFNITSGAGNDTIKVRSSGETVNTGAGADSVTITGSYHGHDTVNTGSGNDIINFAGVFDDSDHVDGGAGYDILQLNGDYASAVYFAATTLTNVEAILLAAGHDYSLSPVDATIAAGQSLFVDGGTLGAGNKLSVFGSTETDGSFHLEGGAGNDQLRTGAGNDIVNGAGGNDVISSGNGVDAINGGDGADTIYMGAFLDSTDTIDGGTGLNSLYLGGDYSAGVILGASTLQNVQLLFINAAGTVDLTFADGNVAALSGLTINDGGVMTAADTLKVNAETETSGKYVFTISGPEHLALTGGGGNDIFTLLSSAPLKATDQIAGNAGTDRLDLHGDYAAGFVFGAKTMTGIDQLLLSEAYSYKLTLNDGNVAAGQTLYVSDGAQPANASVTVNGAAETDGRFDFQTYGVETVSLTGGAGNDQFARKGNFTAADHINGGAGLDNLTLDGNYSGLVLGAGTLVNVENIYLTGGHDYAIKTANATVAAGQTLTVAGDSLGVADHLSFDGSAETDGRFVLHGGLGADTLTGGAGDDSIFAAGGADTIAGNGGNDTISFGDGFDAADTIDGGSGFDTVSLNGAYPAAIHFTATTMTNVETLQLSGSSFDLTTADATVAAGQTLDVEGLLGAGQHLVFDGSAETDGAFHLVGAGGGSDTLAGGAGSDYFWGRGGSDMLVGNGGDDTFFFTVDEIDLGDVVTGGAGIDTLRLQGDMAGTLALPGGVLAGVERVLFDPGHDYTIATSNAGVVAGQTLTVDASQLVFNALSFDGSAETDGSFAFLAGRGQDVLTGGAKSDSFDLTLGGNDIVHGGGGNDVFDFGAKFDASDHVDGGTGTDDRLLLTGDYAAGLSLAAASLTNVERMVLGGGFSYKLTMDDGNVAAGQKLIVDGAKLGAADNLTFDGSAETNGSFGIKDGAGNDVLTGGAGADQMTLKGGNDVLHGNGGNDSFAFGASLTAADKVDGGAGSDIVTLDGDYSAGLTFQSTTMTGIETIALTAGHAYTLTSNSATVAAGATLTVDGSTLGLADVLKFNGVAETNGLFALIGGAAADILTGGSGADTLTGGLGKDILTGGGGADTFRYGAAAESDLANTDTIKDFVRGTDKIDVHLLDANSATAGDDAFHIGATAGHTGDITAAFDTANNRTIVNFFTNGDATADFRLILTGDQHLLTAADILL